MLFAWINLLFINYLLLVFTFGLVCIIWLILKFLIMYGMLIWVIIVNFVWVTATLVALMFLLKICLNLFQSKNFISNPLNDFEGINVKLCSVFNYYHLVFRIFEHLLMLKILNILLIFLGNIRWFVSFKALLKIKILMMIILIYLLVKLFRLIGDICLKAHNIMILLLF